MPVRAEHTIEGRGDPAVQAAGGLRDHRKARGHPGSGPTVQREHPAHPGQLVDRLQGVRERRLGQRGRLGRGELTDQAGLDLAGDGLLRQHHDGPGRCPAGHDARTFDMSWTACHAPSGVPVTFDRPRRLR
jgi:hypothetical protein